MSAKTATARNREDRTLPTTIGVRVAARVNDQVLEGADGVVLRVFVHPRGQPYPRSDFVAVLHQRPRAPRPAFAELIERPLQSGVAYLHPRQRQTRETAP